MKLLHLTLDIKTISEANCSQHWSIKHKRHTKQKKRISYEFKIRELLIPLPCHIKLTRISYRSLDAEDNLPCAFKWIKDQIAAEITGNRVAGRADDDKRMTWEYGQEKGSPQSIRIEIFV